MAAFPPVAPPDPVGLIKALASGVVMTGDPFFALTVFTVIHYPSITPVIPMFAMGELAIWELIVRMLFVANYGVLAGLALFWGMGSPILFPTHTIDDMPPQNGNDRGPRRRLRVGAFTMVIAIWLVIQYTLQVSGFYFHTFPFGQDGSISMEARTVVDIIALIIGIVFLIWPIVDTLRAADGSSLAIAYYGKRATKKTGALIMMFVLFLVLVNAPQAIMDFGAAPPVPSIPLWGAGLIALTIELLVILGFYYLMPYLFGNMDETVFSPANSGVTWGEWCIYVALIYFIADVLYISIASTVITAWTSLATLLSGIAAAIAIVGVIAYFRRRSAARAGKAYWHIRGQPAAAVHPSHSVGVGGGSGIGGGGGGGGTQLSFD